MSKVSREPAEVGSNAVYDHSCQICADRGEREAVRFCMSCDTYMCQTCCDVHKKIPLTINHKVLGKEKFGDIHTVKGLFEKRLIPTLTTQYPAESRQISLIRKHNKKDYSNNELHVFDVQNDPNSENMLYFLFQDGKNIGESLLEIGTVDHKSGYSSIFSRFVSSIKQLDSDAPCHNCNNMKYTIIPKTNMVIKYCSNHQAAHIAFELQAGNQCYAITPFNNGLAIAVNLCIDYALPNWKIEIVKQDGKPITEFYYDDDGKPLLDSPKSLASNSSQDILFVSNQSSVLALDRKGTVIFKYLTQWIIEHITCDTEGNVYLAGDGRVIQIDKHRKKSRDLLNTSRFNISEQTVGFNARSQQLVVINSYHKITYFKFV